jgi:hypothetical protein
VLLKQLTVAIDDLKNGNVDPQLSKAGLRVLTLQAITKTPPPSRSRKKSEDQALWLVCSPPTVSASPVIDAPASSSA